MSIERWRISRILYKFEGFSRFFEIGRRRGWRREFEDETFSNDSPIREIPSSSVEEF